LDSASQGLRLALGFSLVAIAAVPWMLAALLLLPWRALRIRLVNHYGHLIGYAITRLAGCTPLVRDRELLDGSFPAIYVANHTSILDVFICIWLCPMGGCGVVKKEVVRIPFFGQLYLLSGHLMIDRNVPDKAIAALNEIAALVRKHRLGIWIMPEGTRSRDGRLQPFKPGFVHLAIATGLPVVPVVLHGVHRCWKPGSLRSYPIDLNIEVLPPIDTGAWRLETARSHAQEVHDRLAARLGPDQRPVEEPERRAASARAS
jgi:1-acyl-sn-glycerol-3-phosphate acyltransferase